MHLKTFGSSQIEAQKTIYSFPGVVSPKSILTHAAELLKKIILGRNWISWSQIDVKLMSNWQLFHGGYDSHICHQDWYLRLLLLNSHHLVFQVQFSHNLDGTWHIAHLQNWPKKWSIYYSSLSVRRCAWYLWPARPSDLTSSSLLSRVASRSNWPTEHGLGGFK